MENTSIANKGWQMLSSHFFEVLHLPWHIEESTSTFAVCLDELILVMMFC